MFFLYYRTTRPTGKVLARALGSSGFGTCKTLKERAVPFLVRWGNSEQPHRDRNTLVLNKAEAIQASSDKLVAFQRMAGSGVRVPRFTTDPDSAAAWGTVVFGRTRRGSKGQGITVYPLGTRPQRGHALYTEFIANSREYRLHVVNGVVIRVQRKYLEREVLNRSDYIKNHENGYVFKQPQNELKQSRKEMAVAAVHALGLDFGAVDMVIDAAGQEYVLEVNTAPACSPLTARKYVEALAPLIRERSNGVVQPVVRLEVLAGLSGD